LHETFKLRNSKFIQSSLNEHYITFNLSIFSLCVSWQSMLGNRNSSPVSVKLKLN